MGALVAKKPDTRAPWVAQFRASLPNDCYVEYLRPNHDENPTLWSYVNGQGEERCIPGTWCWVAACPGFPQLEVCLRSLLVHAMGLGERAPGRFFQCHADSKFLTRTNSKASNTWESRHSLTVAPVGVVTEQFSAFLVSFLQERSFALFDGSLACSNNEAFRLAYPCQFQSTGDAVAAITLREKPSLNSFIRSSRTRLTPRMACQLPCR